MTALPTPDSKSEAEVDAEGYRVVPKSFTSGGYLYTFVEQLDSDWCIYSAANPRMDNKIFDYELVRFTKSEEYQIKGSVITKRWNYPTAHAFGRNGFSCHSLTFARTKHKTLTAGEAVPVTVSVPVGTEFTVRGLSEKLNMPYTAVYLAVRALKDKVKVIREQAAEKGKATRVLIYQP